MLMFDLRRNLENLADVSGNANYVLSGRTQRRAKDGRISMTRIDWVVNFAPSHVVKHC